jgi:hypothetical protein
VATSALGNVDLLVSGVERLYEARPHTDAQLFRGLPEVEWVLFVTRHDGRALVGVVLDVR